MTDSARTRLIDRARHSGPVKNLNRYVADNAGDVEGALWGHALGDTRQTAGRSVRRGAQEVYAGIKHRVGGGPEEEKKAGLDTFFTKLAMSLVKAPKMVLKAAPTPKSFSVASKATPLKYKASPAVVKPNRSITAAMSTATPGALK